MFLREERNSSSTSLVKYNLPLIQKSTMGDVLLQQATQDEPLLPRRNSVDNELFFYKQDPTSLFHFLQTVAHEPSIYRSSSNKFFNTNSTIFSLTDKLLPLKLSEQDKNQMNNGNCDTIQPVNTNDVNSDNQDNNSLNDELSEDTLITIDTPLNIERHFRRRKRRSSLTRTSSLNDETEIIENVDGDTKNFPDQKENSSQINEVPLNENKSEVNEVLLQELSLNENKSNLPNRFRRRRLKFETPSTSDTTVEFYLPTEPTVNSSQLTLSPVLTENVSKPAVNSNVSAGGLKRINSSGTTKKVRFADSVGGVLAQVQYIQSLDDNHLNELSLKNNVYVPNTLHIEHKPWSFDVAVTSNKTFDIRIPRRFFCLFRQPNSEHPDVYLHEVWKSQIKLEHAEIRVKPSSNHQQYLYGTLWVTNINYWKHVTVKYSFNRWLNTCEYETQHLCHSNDFRNIDKFQFSIDIPNDIDRIDFVLRYSVNGQEHWDNNEGNNYTFETESAYIPQNTISLPHDCNFDEMRFY